jgi:ADP-ribose pyrophosphatase YjhB (NUDIX family)
MRYRFCPRCGGALQSRIDVDGSVTPACSCCGFVFYRNSKLAVGALVKRDGQVLLARRAIEPATGMWDIPGGFLQHGEHPEAGVVRELREESGIEIRPTALIGMYVDVYGDDDEDDPDFVLNLYYEAVVVRGDPVAADDVAEFVWLSPQELPESRWAFRHSPEVIADWRRLCAREAGQSRQLGV